ncbi:MAG: asparaginase domain-containing protein [Elusimicrobiaceae bacterium]|nr:asparaginase domain-containing protein [Elusimicrobiota bacterium]
MSVRIIATGGTFDKEYNELTGELFFTRTHLKEVLKMGRCRLPAAITQLMLKDSLFMTDKDRAEIAKACKNAKEASIVITHGTDTMENTAQYLGARIKNKTVVLTGAMIPYKFGTSDGIFNLATAMAFAQSLPNGVYVAMNGKLFSFDNVTKNKKKGIFVSKV